VLFGFSIESNWQMLGKGMIVPSEIRRGGFRDFRIFNWDDGWTGGIL
jgi:hypothetical protein